MNRLHLIAIVCVTILLTTAVQADVLVGTDFVGRSVSSLTASNITYTTTGVDDPGNLLAVENEMNGVRDTTTENGGLFDTAAAQGYFALDLNVENEDGWYFDVPLTFAAGTVELNITTLGLSINHFNNAGDAQTNISPRSDYRADLIGSVSGVVATDNAANQGGAYPSGPYNVPLDLTATLSDSETWTLRIFAVYVAGAGNNVGFNGFELNGTAVVPEPASLLLISLGGLALIRRRLRG